MGSIPPHAFQGRNNLKKRRLIGFGTETWFCPPLVVIGSAEVTQLAGVRSGLSCKTQPVAVSGQEKLKLPATGGAMLTSGIEMKFATKV
jgi:hypothetical protein